MNRRKQSTRLSIADIDKIHAAHDRAIQLSLPLNVLATVRSPDKHGIDSLTTLQARTTFQKHLWQFGYRFEFPMAYVWVGEAGKADGFNPHQHYLIHIPPAHYQTFYRLAHTKGGGRWLPGYRTIDVRPITDMDYLLNVYLIKQSESGTETGLFFGQRVGMSRNLNGKVYPIKGNSIPATATFSPLQTSVF